MKKVGKITSPYRFRALDLIDRVPEELWKKIHNIVQEAVTKIIPKKKKCKETVVV